MLFLVTAFAVPSNLYVMTMSSHRMEDDSVSILKVYHTVSSVGQN